MTKKGISPLIAAVMLIFITMVIAGIMATWATSLFRSETSELECIGAMSVDYPTFTTDGNISVKIANTDRTVVLSGITVYITYPDKSTPVAASAGGLADPLNPATIGWFNYDDLGDSRQPLSLTVMASSCPRGSVTVNF